MSHKPSPKGVVIQKKNAAQTTQNLTVRLQKKANVPEKKIH
jgi:hypothetical protein